MYEFAVETCCFLFKYSKRFNIFKNYICHWDTNPKFELELQHVKVFSHHWPKSMSSALFTTLFNSSLSNLYILKTFFFFPLKKVCLCWFCLYKRNHVILNFQIFITNKQTCSLNVWHPRAIIHIPPPPLFLSYISMFYRIIYLNFILYK